MVHNRVQQCQISTMYLNSGLVYTSVHLSHTHRVNKNMNAKQYRNKPIFIHYNFIN